MHIVYTNTAMESGLKVIGIGGAGSNVVRHMIEEGVQGVDFIVANTDAQALNRNPASVKIPLGPLDRQIAGSDPEAGRAAAEVSREVIREQLSGAHMVFIIAGMGGGIGTGAAPVVAEIARKMGILTVGVVSKPFEYEDPRCIDNAKYGIAGLSQQVDSLVVIENEKLREVMGASTTVAKEVFHMADDVLKNVVMAIVGIINGTQGLVNIDFEDVRAVMSETGRAMVGCATAAGVDRARVATGLALAPPFLEDVELSSARAFIVHITGSEASLKISEVTKIMAVVRACASEDARILHGVVHDDTLGDELRVTAVATGMEQKRPSEPRPPEPSFEIPAFGRRCAD
ncbi:MAG: cell division protein FtsZ [Zoogloeaceae bacterium]|jgi:cell division protein FtsZ|nr:cell division protein FtsZ [Zoogloeaceae bacterium]